jgi:hypothetical protein
MISASSGAASVSVPDIDAIALRAFDLCCNMEVRIYRFSSLERLRRKFRHANWMRNTDFERQHGYISATRGLLEAPDLKGRLASALQEIALCMLHSHRQFVDSFCAPTYECGERLLDVNSVHHRRMPTLVGGPHRFAPSRAAHVMRQELHGIAQSAYQCIVLCDRFRHVG